MFLFKGLRAFAPLEGVSSALLTCSFCSSHCLPVPCESLPSCLSTEGSKSAELPCGRGWGRATAGARQLPEGGCSGKLYWLPSIQWTLWEWGGGSGGQKISRKDSSHRPCLSEVADSIHAHKQACPNIYGARMRVSAALASPGSCWTCRILGPTSESESLGLPLRMCMSNTLSRWFVAH